MGYPMTYRRVVERNHLRDQFTGAEFASRNDRANISLDLERLERDQRDETHLSLYAMAAGITPEQAKTVLDAFFGKDAVGP